MQPEEFKRIVKMINSICVNQIATNDTMSVYYALLKDISYNDILKGITLLAKTKENNYHPFSPAEIRNAALKEQEADLLLFADSIFNQIKLDIIKYPPEKRPKYLPAVNKALERIGGYGAISNATDKNLFFLKKDFKKEIMESPDLEQIKECMIEVENKRQLLLKA